MNEPQQGDEFAFADHWRWYWRYLLAIAIAAATTGVLVAIQDKPQWWLWIVGLFGYGWALRIAREAGCAALVLIALGLLWIVGSWATDAMPAEWKKNLPWAVLFVGGYVLWYDLSEKIQAMRKEIRSLQAISERIEQQGNDAYDRHYNR